MASKILYGLIGIALMVAFLGPIVFKLKEMALAVVVIIGLLLMLVDMVQALRAKD